VLVDPGGAVLLMEVTDPSNGHSVWITPGGGVDRGETAVDGLRRELNEELALVVAAEHVGPIVWTRTHVFRWDHRAYDQTEQFFLVETERFTPVRCADGDPASGDPAAVVECPHRWWTAAEIAASDADFAPSRLAHALATLLEHGPPGEPIDVGV
jgi:8-oxo-dGTP pyrophosphatase MutT (NUDIX family)